MDKSQSKNVFEAVAMEMTREMVQLTDRGLDETHNIIRVNHVQNESLECPSTSEGFNILPMVTVAVGSKRNLEQSVAPLPDLDETLVDQSENTEPTDDTLELQQTINAVDAKEQLLKQKIEEECKNLICHGDYDKLISKPSTFDDSDSVVFDEHLENIKNVYEEELSKIQDDLFCNFTDLDVQHPLFSPPEAELMKVVNDTE